MSSIECHLQPVLIIAAPKPPRPTKNWKLRRTGKAAAIWVGTSAGVKVNMRALRAVAAAEVLAVLARREQRLGGPVGWREKRRILRAATVEHLAAWMIALALSERERRARALGVDVAAVMAEAERRYQSGERGKAGRPPNALDRVRPPNAAAMRGGKGPLRSDRSSVLPELARRPRVEF